VERQPASTDQLFLTGVVSGLSSTKSVKVPPVSIPIKVTAGSGPGRGLCEQSGRKGIARRRRHCACAAIIRTVTKVTARETDTATEIATASAKFSSSSNTGGLDDLGSSDFCLRYEDNSVKRWVMFRISVRLQYFQHTATYAVLPCREPSFSRLSDSYLLKDQVQSVTCRSTQPEYRFLMRPARGIVGQQKTFLNHQRLSFQYPTPSVR